MEKTAMELFKFFQSKLEGIPMLSGISGIIIILLGICFLMVPFLKTMASIIIKTGTFIIIVSILAYFTLFKIGPYLLQ